MLNENPGPNSGLNWDDARLADETAAAMRDLASTVTDAPPLRLAAAPDELGFPGIRPWSGWRHVRHLRTWVIPAAAAVAVAAVAIALVLIRSIPNGRVPSPAPPATSATPVSPSGTARVPEYYVAWMQADRPYLVVGSTFTGRQYSTVPSPPGVRLDAVYGGSADDRTWLVHGTSLSGPGGGTEWYVLTIAPGTRNPLEMGSAGIPVSESPAGAALSPDGKDVAVAVNGAQPSLRVYSLQSGALLHSWSAPSGKFAAITAKPDAWHSTAMVLRWSSDGTRLGFAWNATAIRVLDTAAPDGSLTARSRDFTVIGTSSSLDADYTCNAWQGWELTQRGRGSVCGGGISNQWTGTSRPGAPTATCQGTSTSVGFLLENVTSQGGGVTELLDRQAECSAKAQPGDGAYIGWASDDGTVLIGSVRWNGDERFGLFSNGRFTPLPALPASLPIPAGMLDGTVVW